MEFLENASNHVDKRLIGLLIASSTVVKRNEYRDSLVPPELMTPAESVSDPTNSSTTISHHNRFSAFFLFSGQTKPTINIHTHTPVMLVEARACHPPSEQIAAHP